MSGNGDKTGKICPLMSGQLVMTEAQAGGVLTPGKPVLIPTKVVCAREQCQWWNKPVGRCAKMEQAEATLQIALSVMEMKTALEPLRLLIGSLRRLCDKLNDVTLVLETMKGK